jgi:hypothetical protein
MFLSAFEFVREWGDWRCSDQPLPPPYQMFCLAFGPKKNIAVRSVPNIFFPTPATPATQYSPACDAAASIEVGQEVLVHHVRLE